MWSELDIAEREKMYEQIGREVPLGRVGEVEHGAYAYLYCMTQSYGSGAVIPVNGGSVLV